MKKIEKYRLVACVAMAIATLFDPATARSAETASPVGGRELAVEMGAPFHDHAILQRGMARMANGCFILIRSRQMQSPQKWSLPSRAARPKR
jgi:hypothetical protein